MLSRRNTNSQNWLSFLRFSEGDRRDFEPADAGDAAAEIFGTSGDSTCSAAGGSRGRQVTIRCRRNGPRRCCQKRWRICNKKRRTYN
ncbi:hypothetical protein MPLDJ20_110316 [Mesorhizobium plurifarium]|uniref:Uncharacterized protein n=1 Tax=Mesorhizobium plurifarium TaxID=69974 RepID=A0A090E076_MESPL|nr:hypothetical protein MPLDJ20_110316 [Mesorhizobium plurifarium]